MKITEFIEFLQILKKYSDRDYLDISPAHDEIYIGVPNVDLIKVMTNEDKIKCEKLGWSVDNIDNDGWMRNV